MLEILKNLSMNLSEKKFSPLTKITIAVPGRWHAFDLARELHKQGYLYRLITTYPKSRTRAFGLPDEKVISFPWMIYLERMIQRCFGLSVWRKYFADPFMALFSRLAARRIDDSDLVHGWSGSSDFVFRRAQQLGIPCVVERSSSHMLRQCELLREEYPKYGMVWTETSSAAVDRELREYEMADQVFVPSKFVWDSFVEKDFPFKKLFKSNFGVNLDKFKYSRDSFNHHQPLQCIFTSARGVRKGLRYLTEAFSALAPNTATLVMVGGQEPGMGAFLPKVAGVEIFGHVSQEALLDYYKSADVFIHPSIEEGLALVQAQALAAGLALVCTTNTGGEDLLMLSGEEPELIKLGILKYPAGFVVPACDGRAIQSCIELLAKDRELLEQMQREAIALCDRGNDWSDYAMRNAQQYAELVEGMRRL